MIKVRIAPSPTGYLHVGTARTAIFNWLLARNQKGKFVLRIEDTDIKRSSQEMTQSIIDSLKWMGLNWDEGPILQCDRLENYKKNAEALIKTKLCDFCYCTEEDLKPRKQAALAEKKSWKCNRPCLSLPSDERQKWIMRPAAVRFFTESDGKVSFMDKLHGELTKDLHDIEDFVLMKSDGTPSYNFACVVDDHEMGITHILRGEDHISNTFKQIIIYKAFGWEPPVFIHVPMILGADRSKLSKRHGAVSVLEYRDKGILPETLVNFLALLGWSPGGDREVLSMEELISEFSLDKLGVTGSIFDYQKLEWMNGEHINRLSDDELLERIKNFSKLPTRILYSGESELRFNNHINSPASQDFSSTLLSEDDEYNKKVIALLKPRMKTLLDMESYFFVEPTEYDEKGAGKYLTQEGKQRLELLKTRLSELTEFSVENIEAVIRAIAGELGIGAGLLIHPLRLALTGKTVGPSLFHLVEVLGKERVMQRIEKTMEWIKPS
ncbi:MAG: glutamate--tRNA ligase [bacterium]|nr:glutamate--tRNA ligase [bacterium]